MSNIPQGSGRSRRSVTDEDIQGMLNVLNKSHHASLNPVSYESERRNSQVAQNCLNWFSDHGIAISEENGRYVLV